MKKSKEKNVLNLVFAEGDVSSCDPMDLVTSTRGQAIGKLLFEGLTRLNANGEYELAGAKKLEISPCKTRYLFTLRSNYYDDGSPVLAFDYERGWKRVLSPYSKCAKAHLFYCIEYAQEAKMKKSPTTVIGVKALDNHTLLVKLKHPVDCFLALLANPIFAPYKEKEKKILFNGPFTIDQWKKGNILTLKKNSFFWNHNVHLQQINILNVESNETAFQMYKKQEIDWIGGPFTSLSTENVLAQGNKEVLFQVRDVVYPFWMYVNTEFFPFSSPLIRKAFSCVIDRKEIAEHIFKRSPLFNPLPKYFLFSNGSLKDSDIVKGKKLFEEGLQLLGINYDDFPTITLSCCQLDNHRKLAEYLQEKWSKIFGICIRVNVQDWNTFYHNLQTGNYHIGGAFFSGDYDSPLAYLEGLADKSNFPRWKHPRYQEIIKKIKEEYNSQQDSLLREAEEILREELPIIPIINGSFHYSHTPFLQDIVFDFRGVPDLSFVRLEEKKNENLFLPLDQK